MPCQARLYAGHGGPKLSETVIFFQTAEVKRPAEVSIRYLDETGATQTLTADGLLAACIQHEIDHLNGVLFIDHISRLKRDMITRRVMKELRQTTAS